jgi:hypothetical protein
MVIYEYICKCGAIVEKVFKKTPKYRPSSYLTCKCGLRAARHLTAPSTDLVNNVRYSNSMGVNIRQIPEAMRKYLGSEYDHKGRLKIKNRKHKLFEMKRRRLVEFE